MPHSRVSTSRPPAYEALFPEAPPVYNHHCDCCQRNHQSDSGDSPAITKKSQHRSKKKAILSLFRRIRRHRSQSADPPTDNPPLEHEPEEQQQRQLTDDEILRSIIRNPWAETQER